MIWSLALEKEPPIIVGEETRRSFQILWTWKRKGKPLYLPGIEPRLPWT
jgi:hypothetical protein